MSEGGQENPPFRAEHIGSFLRPRALLDARQLHADGVMSAGELCLVEDQAIRDVVLMQEKIGLQSITDGEFRRETYSDNFTTTGLAGVAAAFKGTGDWAYSNVRGDTTAARVPEVHAKLEWRGGQNAKDFAFLSSLTSRSPKMTLPGPAYLHYRAGRAHISADAYPDLDAFWTDLVTCYAKELASLGEAGCRYVQLDETSLAKLGDPKIRRALAERGDDWEDLLDVYTDAINEVVAAAPDGMCVGMHLCRGNNRGHWQAEGGYGAIAEKLFRKVRIGFFFLEYDSPRAGSFEPLAEVLDGKKIVLGLVSTKTGDIESADELKRRIDEAARYVPLCRLCLSPQCGFASTHEGNELTPDQQATKIGRVIEVANDVWGANSG